VSRVSRALIGFVSVALLVLVGNGIFQWFGSGWADWMDHHLVPIIIPLLLLMDGIILFSARREHDERLVHIKEVKANTEQITRRDYELVILHGIQTAEERVYCYWHSLNPVEKSDTYKEINKELIKKNEVGLDVHIVVAADPSRIGAAYELFKEGVKVEFKESLVVSDLRFSVFDRQTTVFGVPESAIEDGKPSRHGLEVSSRKLNALFAEYFLKEVSAPAPAVSFKDFVKSWCTEPETKTDSVEMVAEQLQISESLVEEVCPQLAGGHKSSQKESLEEKWRRWLHWPW
jgi:hypothetical protein